MAAATRADTLALIDEIEEELQKVSYVLGKTEQCLKTLDAASRINADLMKEIGKGRYLRGVRLRPEHPRQPVSYIASRRPLPYQAAGREMRTAAKTLRSARALLKERTAEVNTRLSGLRSRLRRQ